MAERITLDHVKNRLAHLQQLFPQFCQTWKIDLCGNREYRVMDTAPKNQVQYPLGQQAKSAKELFNLLADSIEPLFQSMAKPFSVETIEVKPSEIADLAQSIADFLEDCQPDDVVVKLANSAFEENYVLVVE